jgi:hypothetical protein
VPRTVRRGSAGALTAISLILAVAGCQAGPPGSRNSELPADGAGRSLPIDVEPSNPGLDIVTVDTVPSLLSALADDSVDVIVVRDGTYHVSPASDQKPDSLWIGSRFAARTRPVTVQAATRGGVTFDGGGADYFGCISFEQGAHDQVWDGFNCSGGDATATGVITFGGLGRAVPGSPNHITMRSISILASCTGSSTTASGPTLDHAFYIADAAGPGPHDLLFDDINVDGEGGLASAFQFFHSEAGAPNASNVTIHDLTVVGTQEAIILADPTLRNITIDSAKIVEPLKYGVFYETQGAQGILLSNITSTGSGSGSGFFSAEGPHPAGVRFSNNSFH